MAIDPVNNVGKRNLPAIPYDQNNRRPAVLVLPQISAGEVIGYLPARATDNGDGTATLKVDSEFTLDVDNISLTNLKVGSTDQTAANSRFLKTSADGTVQVAGVIAGFTQVNMAQWGGTPQTGADLTPSILNLDVALSTRASELTLSSILGDTTTLALTVDADTNVKVQEARLATATTAAVDVDNSITPATLILAANAARKEYTVVHEDPSATVYIGFADTVTTLTGIPVVGNQMYGSNKFTGDIYAVASVAGPISVRVAEVA